MTKQYTNRKLLAKIMIIGPMTGLPQWNYPAFHAAEARLSGKYWVENPARNFGGRTDLSWQSYLRASIRQLTTVEYVYKLPGWHKSKGAILESIIAWFLGIRRII
jgi:hypothetical protein